LDIVKKFEINEHLRVVLTEYGIEVRFNNTKFFHCYHVPINFSVKKLTSLSEIQPFDEFQEAMKFEREIKEWRVSPSTIFKTNFKKVPNEDLFWVQCSNLQVWAENNYNSNLLPNRIAFPLLKKLVELGDLKAKEVFEIEIVKRLESNHLPTINFLLEEGYLSYLGGSNAEKQLIKVLNNLDTDEIKGFDIDNMVKNLDYLNSKIDIVEIPNSFKPELYKVFQKGNIEKIIDFLFWVNEGHISLLKRNELDDLIAKFNYSIINTAELDQIQNLLTYLMFIDYSDSEIYRGIVLRALEDKDNLEDLIYYLIYNDNLKILTKEELESLNIKQLSFDSGEEELYSLPDSLGNLKNLEVLDLSYAPYLSNLPKSILQLKNLKTVILPSWGKSFKLPQWINQLSWIERLTFRISIVDIEIFFNLKDFFDTFTGPEIARLFKKLHSFQYRSHNNYRIPVAIFDLLKIKLTSLKDQKLLDKTRLFLVDFTGFIFQIIDKIGDMGKINESNTLKDEAIEKIGKRFSSIFKKYVKNVVKKYNNSELSEMMRNNWLKLLNKEDLIDLIKDEEIRFLEKIVEVESDWEYYGLGAETDEIVFEYVLETVPPKEAFFLKELKSLLNDRILVIYKGYVEERINAIEIRNDHIESLFIRKRNFEGMPESIENLKHLELLDVDTANLHSLPKSIGNLRNLKQLRIYDCRIQELPEEIGNLNLLERLEITSCDLVKLPKSIGNLESLKDLDLFGNSLKDIPESIGNLKSLEYLNLGRNLFTTLPESIANITSLNEFDIQQNPSLIIPNKLKKLVDDYYDFGASIRLILEAGSNINDRTALQKIEKFPLPGEYKDKDWKQRLEAILKIRRLSDYSSMILNAVRDRIVFKQDSVINETMSDIGLGLSKLGGFPDVPHNFDWPMWKGRALNFLMQINLSDLKNFEFVPSSLQQGFLYFFFDPQQEDWGAFYPENKEAWRVIYADEERSNLVRRNNPSHEENQKVRACKIYFHRDIHLPSQTIHLFQTMRGDGFTWSELGDIDSDFLDLRYKLFRYDTVDNNHALFGYPDMIQEGPYLSDWVHLLQLGSDDQLKWLWGGYRARGKLHFYVKEDDLKKKNFKDVHMILDCY
jgi:uncharacterized protein YwqG/Leucine-rich repeat (LRR) protein